MFNHCYRNKTVLVTGHTGFKGSWLVLWLKALGAQVIGYSAYLPSEPSHFKVARLDKHLTHIQGDVRDFEKLLAVFKQHQPEVVFHLAAQPIVRRSYMAPKETFDVNIGGTVNVLEAIRSTSSVKAAVMITSDKCYRNQEWAWGYRENDELGGDDPYSASKAGAEIVCRSYIASFLKTSGARVATARAGNVIGGGDWAEARIIPDCVRAWTKQQPASVRNPAAARPWQHVLEPLGGYLWLGAQLLSSSELVGESFNFGPDANVNQSVAALLDAFIPYWGKAEWQHEKTDFDTKKESTLLKLSCDKALHYLQWHAVLSFAETVQFTAEWYRYYYDQKQNIYDFSRTQIERYAARAQQQKLLWSIA